MAWFFPVFRVFFPALFRAFFPDLSFWSCVCAFGVVLSLFCLVFACFSCVLACFSLLFPLCLARFLQFFCVCLVCALPLGWFSFLGGVLWVLSCFSFLWSLLLPLCGLLLRSGVPLIFPLRFPVCVGVRLCVLSVALPLCFAVRSLAWAWVLVVSLVCLRFLDSPLFVCLLSCPPSACLFGGLASVCLVCVCPSGLQ